MINTLYFLINGEVVRVSHLLHKPRATENLLSNHFNLNPIYWNIFLNAFIHFDCAEGVNGFMYDTKLTEGIQACGKTEALLWEVYEDATLDAMIEQQGREAIEKASGLS